MINSKLILTFFTYYKTSDYNTKIEKHVQRLFRGTKIQNKEKESYSLTLGHTSKHLRSKTNIK